MLQPQLLNPECGKQALTFCLHDMMDSDIWEREEEERLQECESENNVHLKEYAETCLRNLYSLRKKLNRYLDILCKTDSISTDLDRSIRGMLSEYYSLFSQQDSSEREKATLGVQALNALDHSSKEIPKISSIVRWMIGRDMAEVLAIENDTFEFPWSAEDFIRCLKQRNCVGMTSEYNDRVVGYMIYELCKSSLNLLSFAVDPHLLRKHVGEQMVDKLKSKLTRNGVNRIFLEVRETNLSAQQFFKSMNFRAVSVLRDFYEHTDEDAYIMEHRLPDGLDSRGIPTNRIKDLL